MNTIPDDTYVIIFSHLSSKNRAEICSVNWRFYKNSVNVSEKNWPKEMQNQTVYDQIILYHANNVRIRDLIVNDYHLTVRCKPNIVINIERACQAGDTDVVDLFLTSKHVSSGLELGLIGACKGGHLGIVKRVVNLGAKEYTAGIYHATYGGFTEIVLYLEKLLKLSSAVPNYTWWTEGACEGGHLDLVKYLNPMTNAVPHQGYRRACRNGHLEIVKYFIENGENDYYRGLKEACEGNKLNIVEYLLPISDLSDLQKKVITQITNNTKNKSMIAYLTDY